MDRYTDQVQGTEEICPKGTLQILRTQQIETGLLEVEGAAPIQANPGIVD
jgi:hypothetical protein